MTDAAVSDEVRELVRALDGLPLAIELAAARVKVLTPAQIRDRLDRSLDLLTGGDRDLPERQRTLRATIEWSYELLDDRRKELLARLSVFAGSFPLEAAEEVCDAAIDDVAALVDASLLKPIDDDRFLLLETIREYSAERLQATAAREPLRRRHADFLSAVAEAAYEHRFDDEPTWSERLAADHDDLRAALDWLEEDDPERALALAGALGWFWLSHGQLDEGCRRLKRALRTAGDAALRARALAGIGPLMARQGAVAEGRARLEEAIDLWRGLARPDELASALDALGWLLFFAGEGEPALDAFQRSLDLQRERGDHDGEVRALVGVCQLLVALDEVDRAEALSQELLELADDPRSEHFALHFLADCALIRGDVAEAGKRYRQSLEAALPLGDVLETSFEVQGIAMAAAGGGENERPLLLAGAVEALLESLGTSLSVPFWQALLDRYLGAARDSAGADAARIWAAGRGLPFDDAVQLALEGDR